LKKEIWNNFISDVMKKNSKLTVVFYTTLIIFLSSASGQNISQADQKLETERTDAYAAQLESYLQHYLTEGYNARASGSWHRDYSSIDAFERSVAPNRGRWSSVVIKPPVLTKSGPLIRKQYSIEGIKGEWIELPLGPITAQAFLAFPTGQAGNKKLPLVIVQHGIGSTPETPFRGGAYHEYAKELLKSGFAVLVPMNLMSIERRNHIERLCRLADISLPGIELVRVQNLLDIVLTDTRIDPQRVGMWGVSLGGMATMFWMPLEPRIKAGVVSAWFNQRLNKMVIPDDRYTSFLVTTEDHAFFTGWLTEFTDHDVVSLICPRPLLIQHGKKDRIAHWPQVIEEYEIARKHYEKLNIPERIEMDMHEGGHEAIIESGISFMKKWLMP
jgi:dienelactone hydrolase